MGELIEIDNFIAFCFDQKNSSTFFFSCYLNQKEK